MTDFANWITKPGIDRCYLVEFQVKRSGVITTLRRATHPYRTGAADVPALTPYPDTVLTIAPWGRELTELFTGYSSTALSSIDFFLDDELADVLETASAAGLAVTVRCGDVHWPLAAFGVVISATAESLVATSYDTARLSLKDPSVLMGKPVQSNLITSGPHTDKPKPICLGRCFNVSPVLINEAARTYQVHDGAIEAITAVRENGVAIPFTPNLAAGTFALNNNAKGRVTADVDGAKVAGVWLQTAAQMITFLLDRFNLGAGSSLTTLPTYQLGIYLHSDKTLASVLDEISASVGAAWFYNRYGQLSWFFFNGPAVSVATIVPDDIEDDTLWPRRRLNPVKSVSLGYRRNWTEQADGLAGVVRETTPALATLYELPESVARVTNFTVAANEPDAADVVVRTFIVKETDANAEATRRASWASVPRFVYEFSAFTTPFNLDLGQTVTIHYPRYFAASAPAVITRLFDDLVQDSCTLEVVR